jgi:CRISPR-associated DxTHG motif protein
MPHRVALSFLGTDKYEPTVYQWQDDTCPSRFMAEAVRQFFEPDRLLVAMTDAARHANATDLRQACDFDELGVPPGNSEEEWWDVFECITAAIPAEAELVVDVTHGFRSQPLVALAAVAYLRTAKDVTVERIVYGAFDAHSDDRNVTEVLDLTAFLSLIDWSKATEQFLERGDARGLRDVLQASAASSKRFRRRLSTGGDKLAALTQAIAMNRPSEAFREARELRGKLANLEQGAENVPAARPLSGLLERVRDRFGVLAEASGDTHSKDGFAA